MANQKKGFVLYFDSLGLLTLFPPDQIGELLLALYDYARRICDREESPEEALERYPLLSPATQVGFCSIAWHILRDTRTWKARQSSCQQAALARHRTSHTDSACRTDGDSSADSPSQQDVMRGYIEQLRRSRTISKDL